MNPRKIQRLAKKASKREWEASFWVEVPRRRARQPIATPKHSVTDTMAAYQESGPDLASVVGSHPEDLAEWSSMKVPSHRPLAQFHAMFWGKSMVDEEKEWRNTQLPIPAIGSELGDKDQDGDECMNQDSEKTMDEGQRTDLDDDIISGCYLLDIGIVGLDFSKIWIRAEYKRVYDFVEAHYKKPSAPRGRAPAVVVTGQPGIGKSVWIYYALRRRLAEEKPVIWYRAQNCFLFTQEGVYKAPPNSLPTDFKVFVWTLVDSDEAKDGVPITLVPHGTRHFVIYTTSPRKERWSRLHKTVRSIRAIMNPWTRAEIFQAALAPPPESIERTRINEIFDRFGPTPRLCIDFLADQQGLNQYKEDLQKAISNVTTSQLEQLFKDTTSLTMDAISHQICLISREKRDEVHSRAVVTPITPSIQSRLANQFRNLERAEKIRLYKYFARVPESRRTAGVFFEAIAQPDFQEEIDLELISMVKLDKARKGAWYSSHVLPSNPALEASRQQALQDGRKINIQPTRTEEFTDDGPPDIELDVYYVPEANNHEALDSFILFNGLLFIFQFTVGLTHGIKQGLLSFFEQYPVLPPISHWRFVFIIPPNLALTCPQPWQLNLREVPLFSAVHDVNA